MLVPEYVALIIAMVPVVLTLLVVLGLILYVSWFLFTEYVEIVKYHVWRIRNDNS